MADLVFIHLSDIHFSKPGTRFDLDLELRNKLELDVAAMNSVFPEATGVVVCGDVAFSGATEEYDAAAQWISSLLKLAKVDGGNVWIVPGNHDIRWDAIRQSKFLQEVHAKLRGVPPREVNTCFEDYLCDKLGPAILFEPLKDFNLFASPFKCDSTAERLFWEVNLKLNDGSVLVLRGLNSAIISDEDDDDEGKSLILGARQMTFLESPGVTYLSMCHHPPQRIREEDEFDDRLQAQVTIQLFGHKHMQRLRNIDGKLRVSAGAVHPSRDELEWQPRYNWLSLHVDGLDEHRKLIVQVWPRVWDSVNRKFIGEFHDGRESRTYVLPLKPWNSGDARNSQAEEAGAAKTPMNVRDSMDPKRKLVYRFLSLPYNQIFEIAISLDLLSNKDKGVEDLELFRRFVRRAEERRILAELWDAVEMKYGDQGQTENPFKTN